MDIAYEDILRQVAGNHFWVSYLSEATASSSPIGIHLAVFSKALLSRVLSSEKTVESRFSRNRCAPYGEIGDGDVIFLKEVAGPIRGVSLARRAWCYDLSAEPIGRVRDRFGDAICADDTFWGSRADALYATLIELDATAPLDAIWCDKRDRRGWVALRSRQLEFSFT